MSATKTVPEEMEEELNAPDGAQYTAEGPEEDAGVRTVELFQSAPGVRTASADCERGKGITHPLGCEWVDLSVSVRVKKRNKGERGVTMKQLVQPTSGYAQSGDLLAVMGPSGSGKTTLLDAIAGRMKSSAVGGSITFDGSVLTDSQHQAFVSYVAQEDSLLGVFTVSETLRMALRFRYGYNMKSEAELKSLESHALKLVGLTSAAGTKVGDIFRKGLSGGQKRRLSLAVELVKAPKVMVLDEPTSGLDSASAFGIMSSLTALAKLGHTIIATIHQPSSDVWTLFDKLLLLSEGRTLFFGESRAAVGYFGALGHQCPELSNPADFFLALINTDFPLHACDLGYLQRAYGKGAPAAAGSAYAGLLPHEVALAKRQKKHVDLDVLHAGKACGFLADCVTLSKRNLLNNLRNPGIFWVRFAMYTMLSLMIGLMYLELGDDFSPSSVLSRINILFFVAAFLVFMSVAVLPFFIIERATFLRERGNGSYSVGTFVLSNVLMALPGIFVIALASTALIVPLAKLNGFGVYLAALTAALFTAEGFMSLTGALVPHYIIGIALGAGVFGFFMLVEGFFIVKDDIPPWFIWVHYLAFHTYIFRAFMANEFEPIASFDELPGGAPAQFSSGRAVLEFYSMADVAIGRDIGIVVAFGFFFYAMYAVVLQLFHTGKR